MLRYSQVIIINIVTIMDMWILCIFELLAMAAAAREAYERIGELKSFQISYISCPFSVSSIQLRFNSKKKTLRDIFQLNFFPINNKRKNFFDSK